MTNNDILRRLRYTFDFDDAQMISLFGLTELKVTREQVSNWMKPDDDPNYRKFTDNQLASFLNGLIIDMRGKKEGPLPEPENRLTNNQVFRKLKIALNLQSDGVMEILELGGGRMSNHELSAFFRKATHKNYRECKDQVLRNFLQGMQVMFRAN